MKKYDVVVVGSGVGGSSAAYALAGGGLNVAMVEEDLWGGTCPNRGCDPKKILHSAVEVVERNNQLVGKGFSPIHSVDWQELMAFKRGFTRPYPEKFRQNAQRHGLQTIKGSARFLSATRLQVAGEVLEADRFVIATGQCPSILHIEGKEYLKTSSGFLDMDEMPQKIIFIGAGYIAFELAAIANAAGADVTIVEYGGRALVGFDEAFAAEMVKAYEAKGVRFAFGVNVEKVVKRGGKFILSGGDFLEEGDYIVGSTGRAPNTEKLGLEKAGVTYTKKGIEVNKYLQTANPAIYACGDVVDKVLPRLTPVSSFEGRYVAQKILDDATGGIAYPPIVTVVYGSPKLAQVGVTPEQAQNEPEKYRVREVDMTGWFTYRRWNEPVAKAKLVFEKERLAGAAVLSSQADDLINDLAIILDKGITHGDLLKMILGSPTIASDLRHLV